jgi:hypothetical protein
MGRHEKRRDQVYKEVKSPEKDYVNDKVADIALQIFGAILLLDGPSLLTTAALIAAGVAPARITVIEKNPETFIKQQETIRSVVKFAGVKHLHGDFFPLLKRREFNVLYFDGMSRDFTDEQLTTLKAWSDRKKGRHSLVATLAARDNRKHTVARRVRRLEKGVPLNIRFEFGYQASQEKQPMHVVAMDSLPGSEPEYRPHKILKRKIDRDGRVWCRVKWFNYSEREATWELEDSDPVKILLAQKKEV